MKPSAILFCGTRFLAGLCLEFLVRQVGRERIAGVLRSPSNPLDAGRPHAGPGVEEVAHRHGIAIHTPEIAMKSIYYDFIVSVLWNGIFKQHQLERAVFGGINLHPAPLPDYRGSLGRSHAILNGDETYGTTVHHMDERVDRGDIILARSFPLMPDDTAQTLDWRTLDYSFPLFCEAWLRLSDGSAPRIPQGDISCRTGRVARFYKRSDIAPYLEPPRQPLSHADLARRYRALFFPPRLVPPEWLIDALRAAGSPLPDAIPAPSIRSHPSTTNPF